MTKKFVVLFLTLLLSAGSLSAQTYGLPGSQPIDPIGYYINQSFWSNKAFTTVMRGELMKSGSKGKSGAAGTSPAAASVTAFKHSGSHILPTALSALNRTDATADKRIVEDLLNLYRQTAINDGFPANDLAYAFEYFVANNYQVYKFLLDINADPGIAGINDPLARLQAIKVKEQMKVTLPQERAIYDQFRRVLSENAEVKKMTDSQKQEASEILAVLTGMAYLQFSQGSRNRSVAQMEKGRQTARTNLEKLVGVSADNVKITNSGLEF